MALGLVDCPSAVRHSRAAKELVLRNNNSRISFAKNSGTELDCEIGLEIMFVNKFHIFKSYTYYAEATQHTAYTGNIKSTSLRSLANK